MVADGRLTERDVRAVLVAETQREDNARGVGFICGVFVGFGVAVLGAGIVGLVGLVGG